MARREIQPKAEQYISEDSFTIDSGPSFVLKMVIFRLRQASTEMLNHPDKIEVNYTRESIALIIDDLQDVIGEDES